MTCDLERIFRELVEQLPKSVRSNEVVLLSSQNLPAPPPHLASDQLYVRVSEHEYEHTWRTKSIDFYARQETYRNLGLLFLAVLFHARPSEVTVNLIHPASDIKRLVVGYEHRELDTLPSGYHTRPLGFVYFPNPSNRHPFDVRVTPHDLPCFALTNADDVVMQGSSQNTVRSFGNDIGTALFGELLLNAGLPENLVAEYNLEGEGGFRGVGIHSVEVRLFLPGSDHWDESVW